LRRTRGLLALALLWTSRLHAQEIGDAKAGLSVARQVCAPCHAVLAGETNSPNRQAPSFEQMARVPGMTVTALTVILQTSHATMPNIMLEPDELRDISTYIVSLGNRP
jgi:mono/diheme cytochrome c family protein